VTYSAERALAGHDFRYVLLAAAICAAAGTASFWLHRRNQENRGDVSWIWVGFQALAGGAGAWAANVLVLLGYRRFPLMLDPWAIMGALVVAVLAGLPTFSLRRKRTLRPRPLAMAAIMAVAFWLIHFTAIAGLRAPGALSWDPAWQVGGVAAAFVLAYLASVVRAGALNRTRVTAGLVLTVLAVGSAHFFAMAGASFQPDPSADVSAFEAPNTLAAAMVAGVSLVLLGGSAAASLMAGLGERKALRRLQMATNAMPSALALFDREDRLLVWNSTFEAIAGPNRSLVREGMRLDELTGSMPGRPESLMTKPDGLAPREPVHVEFPIPGGRWVRVDNVPTEDGGLLSLGTDITETRRSEMALAEALDRAEAANRAKSEFLATMSHEIRTPLNGVLGMAQAMGRDELGPAQRERLEVIQSAGEALLSLLNDVLDISKIEAARIELEDGILDLEAIATDVVATFRALAAEKDISIGFDAAEPARGCWRGDPVRVRQILQNLVANAVKFTDRGSVQVELGHDGRRVVLRVADTGPGIPAEQQAQIFESFAQADASTTRRYGGSGLGLTICRALAELMGGEILLDSLPGQGSTFTLRLPLERAERPEPAAQAAPEAPPVAPALRILAAEDNPMNQLVLKTLLGQAGLEARLVSNGKEALAAWEEEAWDVILMDVQMPVMDGPTATRRIREREIEAGQARTPIIALTANAMSHHVQEYRAAGMDLLVAKPIKLPELFSALRAACEGPAEGSPRAAAG
jgi:signal transduction histidine kinase/NO-binding membrane sensor protein with MHYT domain